VERAIRIWNLQLDAGPCVLAGHSWGGILHSAGGYGEDRTT
jgi:hypothetical protein